MAKHKSWASLPVLKPSPSNGHYYVTRLRTVGYDSSLRLVHRDDLRFCNRGGWAGDFQSCNAHRVSPRFAFKITPCLQDGHDSQGLSSSRSDTRVGQVATDAPVFTPPQPWRRTVTEPWDTPGTHAGRPLRPASARRPRYSGPQAGRFHRSRGSLGWRAGRRRGWHADQPSQAARIKPHGDLPRQIVYTSRPSSASRGVHPRCWPRKVLLLFRRGSSSANRIVELHMMVGESRQSGTDQAE